MFDDKQLPFLLDRRELSYLLFVPRPADENELIERAKRNISALLLGQTQADGWKLLSDTLEVSTGMVVDQVLELNVSIWAYKRRGPEDKKGSDIREDVYSS